MSHLIRLYDHVYAESTIAEAPAAVNEVVGAYGANALEDRLSALQETLSFVFQQVLLAAERTVRPDEVVVKFGLKFAGEAGVPYLSKATAESTISIEAKWTRPIVKEEAKDSEPQQPKG